MSNQLFGNRIGQTQGIHSQSSFNNQQGESQLNAHSTGSSKLFQKAMARPSNQSALISPTSLIPQNYRFPSLGLKIQSKSGIAFTSNNPFKIHSNDQMLLLAHQNTRRAKQQQSKQRTHISLKPIATRTDRGGTIASIKGIRPAKRKLPINKDQLKKDLIEGKITQKQILKQVNTVRRNASEDGILLAGQGTEKINLFEHPDISIGQLRAIQAAQAGYEEDDDVDDLLKGDGLKAIENSEAERKRSQHLNYLKQGMKRESTRDYVLQVRKIFMTGFTIENKKEQTRNLEEYIKNQEEKLSNAKKIFKEDQEKFQKYHMNLKQQANKMSQDLEKEVKRKQSKLNDIFDLNEDIKLIEVEIKKKMQEYDDLENCRQFLQKLRGPAGAPASVSLTRSQASSKIPNQQRIQSKSPTTIGGRKDSTITQGSRAQYRQGHQQSQLAGADSSATFFMTQVAAAGNINPSQARGASQISRIRGGGPLSSQTPLPPGIEPLSPSDAQYFVDSDEQNPIPFEDPKELLEIVQELEQKNLFLIDIQQNNQNTLEKLIRDYEKQKKLVKRQHAEISNNVRVLQDTNKIMRARQDKLRRQIKSVQGGTAAASSPTHRMSPSSPHRGIATAATHETRHSGGGASSTSPYHRPPSLASGSSFGSGNEAVLTSAQNMQKVKRQVIEVYKLCEKSSQQNNQATLLDMLKTIQLYIQYLNQQRDYMIQQGKPVIQMQAKFKMERRHDRANDHKRLQAAKQQERQRKLQKKKQQMRYVFKGRKDVFRTKPVEKRQIKTNLNKGDRQQEDIMKFLELNPQSENSRILLQGLLIKSAEQQAALQAAQLQKQRAIQAQIAAGVLKNVGGGAAEKEKALNRGGSHVKFSGSTAGAAGTGRKGIESQGIKQDGNSDASSRRI